MTGRKESCGQILGYMFFPGCIVYMLQDLMVGWYDMPLAKMDQFISNEAFFPDVF